MYSLKFRVRVMLS